MIKDKQALEGGRISILGARVHNLKNIDVEIPRNKLTVITGMSGSGKSSLAFDKAVCGDILGLRPEFLREYRETRCG